VPVLLDSTLLIDFLRGRPVTGRVDRLVRTGEPVLVSPVNVEEIVRGLKLGEEDNARRLFEGLRTVPIGLEQARQAGRWRADFAAQGVALSQADCLVAVTAMLAAARLATGNPAHFPMAEVEVEHWPVGA
jgi:predicted nucleic acid-binding protein